MKVLEISTELWSSELSQSSSTSPTLISLWLTEHIGELSNLLFKDFSIDNDSEITPDLTEIEKSIYKQLYLIYYYGKLIQNTLSAATASSVLELSEAGATVRLQNKNEIAKSYQALRKDETDKLNQLITNYRSTAAAPSQVAGTDGSIAYNYPQENCYNYPRRGY